MQRIARSHGRQTVGDQRRFAALAHALASVATLILLAGCSPPPPIAADTSHDEIWQGKIVLGSPSLTAGIPGNGPLTIPQIKAWLANPANHRPLEIALPLGLRGSEISPPQDLTRAKIELGRQLFFDHRLSKHSSVACITCHQPIRQFTSEELHHHSLRETAVIFNRVLGHEQFWDGRAKSLEDQIRFPLESEHEMNTTPAECVEQLRKIEGYRLQFTAIFGQVDFASLCTALAAFERVLVTGPSPWDYQVDLSESARRGGQLFFSERTNCVHCHSGPNFTDEQYHDVGLRPRGKSNNPLDQKAAADLGRFQVTGDDADHHAFKTPTLRNVAQTWPYFHDGRYDELREVVEHFVRGGDASCALTPLELSRDEIQDLVAFLESLTGPLPPVATDRLPE